jgi:hypothetical protein
VESTNHLKATGKCKSMEILGMSKRCHVFFFFYLFLLFFISVFSSRMLLVRVKERVSGICFGFFLFFLISFFVSAFEIYHIDSHALFCTLFSSLPQLSRLRVSSSHEQD